MHEYPREQKYSKVRGTLTWKHGGRKVDEPWRHEQHVIPNCHIFFLHLNGDAVGKSVLSAFQTTVRVNLLPSKETSILDISSILPNFKQTPRRLFFDLT